eukprot:2329883-Rhodomonas_salina.2
MACSEDPGMMMTSARNAGRSQIKHTRDHPVRAFSSLHQQCAACMFAIALFRSRLCVPVCVRFRSQCAQARARRQALCSCS